MRRLGLTLLLWFTLLGLATAAELVVVVRADSEIGPLTRSEVTSIFLGRYRELASGALAEPLDQVPQSAEYIAFYEQLINKTASELRAYWARLVFTGRVSPPRVVDNSERLTEQLLANPRAIGYLERGRVDRRLRIVYTVSPR